MDDTPMVPLPELFAASDQQLRAAPLRHHSRGNLSAPEVARLRSSDNNADPDTCRICRGEATEDEPLFYPCKCSGSIKYVHQDCLMEWLSHSQKKHCELCKTPFRFTKLYSPQMPTTLPVHIFIGHVAKYLFKNMMVWLRGALVVTVWLCCLPGLMRSVWSLLFWLSDVGVGNGGPFWLINTPRSRGDVAVADSTSTCPASPLLSASAAADGLGEILRNYSGAPYTASWRGINISTNDSLSSAVMRATVGSLAAADTQLEGTCPAAPAVVADAHTSLLSDVSFLQNLSRYPLVNRTVVHVLEGQIITILVIVCFILVILVRDYVVQQQPEINMRAALEEVRLREERLRAMDVENPTDPVQPPEEHIDPGEHAEIGSPGGRVTNGTGGTYEHRTESSTSDDVALPTPPDSAAADTSSNGNTPLSHAAPAHRPPHDSPVATVHEYLRIYRQEDGDPTRILKAIEDENLEESLNYWARVTRSMMERKEGAAGPEAGVSPNETAAAASTSFPTPVALPPSSAPHFAWLPENPDLDHVRQFNGNQPTADAKGKGKDIEGPSDIPVAEGHVESYPSPAYPLRPRAVSDGPQRHESVNPLANNSWSFAGLPAQTPAAQREAPDEEQSGSPDVDLEPPQGMDDLSTIASEAATAHGHLDMPAPQATPLNEEVVPEAQQTDEPLAIRPPLQRGMMDRLADFMWGDVEAREIELDAEHDALLDEDHHEHDHEHIHEHDHEHDHEHNHDHEHDHEHDDDDDFEDIPEDELMDDRDPEVIEAAAAAGIDPEAVDDAEDIDGILELIGMRGPLVGLFQNAVFCAVLVSVTIFVCVFLPYNIGRVSIWGAMNPSRLLNMVFGLTKFVQDVVVSLTASACSGFLATMYYTGKAFGWWLPSAQRSCHALMKHTWTISANATMRVADAIVNDFPVPSNLDVPTFSAISHLALIDLKLHIASVFFGLVDAVTLVMDGGLPSKVVELFYWLVEHGTYVAGFAKDIPRQLLDPASWVISIGGSSAPIAVTLDLASWSGTDRFWAILCGYTSICVTGALYLRRGAPFSTGQIAQEWEASLIDVLNQASGVMKVILIISIEMLVFPLYCGLLLDVALLPLFEGATIKSRLAFTLKFPLTSIFVHWFVGTGYMFHFALFVSMCRKIMRKGVLYFIRDPDDPEFHPVRDVLERNVTTQLRKILFSAFVYGALVIVCLGGVVWGLCLSLPSVLPIHYSSNEPVLEFPIDLLFYNFAMPLAVKFFRPSDGLHAMYTWWLRKCARYLRLSWFLFGERRIDEEGLLALRTGSPHLARPWWRRYFLELNKSNEVVPKTWSDLFEGGKSRPTSTISAEKMKAMVLKKRQLVRTGQLVKDGVFVRTPASDQVKIPKGRRVFFEVTEDGVPKDASVDAGAAEVYSSDQYQLAYVPPNFRSRMFMFVLLIWIFAAVTGVSFTIVPLIFGRRIFKLMIPAHARTNDIYAFSIGVHILGSLAYLIFRARSIWEKIARATSQALSPAHANDTVRRLGSGMWQGFKFGYTYLMLLVVFPVILASVMELYLIIPLHTYINPPSPYIVQSGSLGDGVIASGTLVPNRHTAHVIQSWTLGLLYVKLGARAITSLYAGTRAASAVRAVLRRGWLHPDVGILTRAFVIPGLVLASIAIFGPAQLTAILERRGMLGLPAPAPHELTIIYRLSYPVAALSAIAAAILWSILRVFSSWKTRIRDEAYLIGERLHNFGVSTAGAGSNGGGPPWRGHGTQF
ncbi:E3 ubiquitin-protein ligase MARCH6 [Plectosphaerella plurivora]|uniref:RING-type E3 ubiquitin transferase n=1 Tax=Plectosphaerella plurivora TaxID=936078 RepID=A0A9P8VI03_9PEZI|nr:E3 ubiquitin-protein ligase MARCH6 [Plectosphaerella plurivora]